MHLQPLAAIVATIALCGTALAQASTDADAIRARIAQLRQQVDELEAEIAALESALPRRHVADYELARPSGKTVLLSELFGERSFLVLVHNMGRECYFCRVYADELEAGYRLIEPRAALVYVGPDSPEELAEIVADRQYRAHVVCDAGTTLAADLGFSTEEHQRTPGVSILERTRDGDIVVLRQFNTFAGDEILDAIELSMLIPERPASDEEPGPARAGGSDYGGAMKPSQPGE
jgi:predicted dithiol-disulfide oxidoreductase (DUF899 family)